MPLLYPLWLAPVVACTHATDLASTVTADSLYEVECSRGDSVDVIVDKLIDKLLQRAVQVEPHHRAELGRTALGKPAHSGFAKGIPSILPSSTKYSPGLFHMPRSIPSMHPIVHERWREHRNDKPIRGQLSNAAGKREGDYIIFHFNASTAADMKTNAAQEERGEALATPAEESNAQEAKEWIRAWRATAGEEVAAPAGESNSREAQELTRAWRGTAPNAGNDVQRLADPRSPTNPISISSPVSTDNHAAQSVQSAQPGQPAVQVVDPGTEVRWLPIVDPTLADAKPRENATVMPLFPLSQTHLPYTSNTLLIFEPRYRAMYNDILFSGARRFLVCNVDAETKRLAEVGTIFYLEELKEVSEQTQDRAKYVGSHKAIGRAKLLKVLNPKNAVSRETYLRAEVEELVDDDEDADTTKLEADGLKLFQDLINTQAELKESPRFSEQVKANLTFARATSSEDRGLWGTISMWQKFMEQRQMVINRKMQRDMSDKIGNFIKSKGIDFEQLKVRGQNQLYLEDLPKELQQEILVTQQRYREELEAIEGGLNGRQFQAILQSSSHAERLSIFLHLIDKERKRLAACSSLQSMLKTLNLDADK